MNVLLASRHKQSFWINLFFTNAFGKSIPPHIGALFLLHTFECSGHCKTQDLQSKRWRCNSENKDGQELQASSGNHGSWHFLKGLFLHLKNATDAQGLWEKVKNILKPVDIRQQASHIDNKSDPIFWERHGIYNLSKREKDKKKKCAHTRLPVRSLSLIIQSLRNFFRIPALHMKIWQSTEEDKTCRYGASGHNKEVQIWYDSKEVPMTDVPFITSRCSFYDLKMRWVLLRFMSRNPFLPSG